MDFFIKRDMMKHKTSLLIIFGLIIMVIMLYFIGIDQIVYALSAANLWYVLLAILLEFVVYFLFALRWYIINGLADIKVSLWKLLPMIMLSLSVNNITPSGRGGGEPVRAYVLTKEVNIPFEETFATVIADRAMDTFPFIVLAILTIISVILNFNLDLTIIAILIIAVVAVILAVAAIVYMSINEGFGQKVIGGLVWLLHKFSKKDTEQREKRLVSAVNGFQETMKVMLSDKDLMYYALPISFLIWIVEISRVVLIFMAFGYPVSPIVIAEVFIISVLVGFIPFLPGGIGLIDGTMILFFASAGIPSGISAAATVIERLISYWMTTFLGLLTIPYYGVNVLENITGPKDNGKDNTKEFDDAVDNIKKLNKMTK